VLEAVLAKSPGDPLSCPCSGPQQTRDGRSFSAGLGAKPAGKPYPLCRKVRIDFTLPVRSGLLYDSQR
jgi:hypothetical protein